MNDLIFLPIELDIISIRYHIDKVSTSTFQGLWNTKELTVQEIKDSSIDHITDQLPYEKITLAKYNTQSSVVPPHVDVQPSWTRSIEEYTHIKNNEPAGYRVVLIGETDSLEVFDNKEWKKAVIPSIPFAYVLNSTQYQHRVNRGIGRQTLYFRGFLDKEKHRKLIEKNLKKYSEYAVFSQ